MGVTAPRLLYIAAWGRSGSTILGNILGALPGVFDAGELRHFWGRSGRQDRTCGCGETLAACPFWREVRAELLADADLPTDDFASDPRLAARGDPGPADPAGRSASSASDLPSVPFGGYIQSLRSLYGAIAKVSGAEVIVDSSKKTGYGALARTASALEAPVSSTSFEIRGPPPTRGSGCRAPSPGLPGPCRGTARSRAASTGSSATSAEIGCAAEAATRSPLDPVRGLRQVPADRDRRAGGAHREGRSECSVRRRPHGGAPVQPHLRGQPVEVPPRPGAGWRATTSGCTEQRRSDRLICELVTLPLLHAATATRCGRTARAGVMAPDEPIAGGGTRGSSSGCRRSTSRTTPRNGSSDDRRTRTHTAGHPLRARLRPQDPGPVAGRGRLLRRPRRPLETSTGSGTGPRSRSRPGRGSPAGP